MIKKEEEKQKSSQDELQKLSYVFAQENHVIDWEVAKITR